MGFLGRTEEVTRTHDYAFAPERLQACWINESTDPTAAPIRGISGQKPLVPF